MRRESIELGQDAVVLMDGSVEVAPKMLVAMNVVATADIVGSGDTAIANNLDVGFALLQFPGAYLVSTERALKELNFDG